MILHFCQQILLNITQCTFKPSKEKRGKQSSLIDPHPEGEVMTFCEFTMLVLSFCVLAFLGNVFFWF